MSSKANEIRFSKGIFVLLLALIVTAAFLAAPVFSDKGTAQADSYKYKLKIKADVLNVRAKASASASRLGQLKKGKKITAYKIVKDGSGAKWYRFKYQGKTAYILAEHAKQLYMTQKFSPKKKAYVDAGALNIRAKASTKGKKVGTLTQNKVIYLRGKSVTKSGSVWYRFAYNKKSAYASADFIKIGSVPKKAAPKTTAPKTTAPATSTQSFEAFMKSQGFPASYKPYLRALHKAHPRWVFYARHTGYSWDALNMRARKVGVNLIDSSVTKAWRSKASSVYNKKTKTWKTFDGGRWYQAKDSVIAYYLDPRNFLKERSVFQFMGHGFDASSQNTATIRSITSYPSYCFMDTGSYQKTLYTAGKAAGVNPNVLTAMIVEEQGWRGGSALISGNCSKRPGYYNFFNIGAYCGFPYSSDKVARGLWYAAGCPIGKIVTAKSYGRPWNSKYKAIKGGALFYKAEYMENNQSTYYTKKFNVMNGSGRVATHEYMTNVMGAEEEAVLLSLAYRSNSNYPIKFYIPVYTDMPSSPCAKPAS